MVMATEVRGTGMRRDERGGQLSRKEEGGGSGRKWELDGSEKEDSPRETVAEAKMGGENWREKRR
uniref:Uncharacterized protein n=1 Tax=Salix viminalis TaxID=40686 RepID=A0A6N2JXD2_SALVM